MGSRRKAGGRPPPHAPGTHRGRAAPPAHPPPAAAGCAAPPARRWASAPRRAPRTPTRGPPAPRASAPPRTCRPWRGPGAAAGGRSCGRGGRKEAKPRGQGRMGREPSGRTRAGWGAGRRSDSGLGAPASTSAAPRRWEQERVPQPGRAMGTLLARGGHFCVAVCPQNEEVTSKHAERTDAPQGQPGAA